MSKAIKMTRSELVWETRVAYFDAKRWNETLAWLKTFADRKRDPYAWEGRLAIVYDRVKDMTFEDIVADMKEYENGTGKNIVFNFKSCYFNGDIREYQESLYDLVIEWLREDCVEKEVWEWNYADDSEENIELVDLND